jgi:hypothetical protein
MHEMKVSTSIIILFLFILFAYLLQYTRNVRDKNNSNSEQFFQHVTEIEDGNLKKQIEILNIYLSQLK